MNVTKTSSGNVVGVSQNISIRTGYSPYIGDDGYWYVYSDSAKKFVKTSYSASGGNVTPEQIQLAVQSYLAENPIDGSGMQRVVLKLIKNSDNTFKITDNDGGVLTFAQTLALVRNMSNYVVIVYGNSKIRPQYATTSEIISIGLDRSSTTAKVLRVVHTPTRLSYETFELAEDSALDNYYTKAEINSQIGNKVDYLNGQLVAPDGTVIAIGSGDGGNIVLNSGAKAMLITILQNAVFKSDQSTNISKLYEYLFASGGSDDDEPTIPDEPIEDPTTISSFLYHFDNNLYADGERDLGLDTGTPHYSSGKFGNALSTFLNSSGYAISTTNLTDKPTLDGDFTISCWAANNWRTLTTRHTMICFADYENGQNIPDTDVDVVMDDESVFSFKEKKGLYGARAGLYFSWYTDLAIEIANSDLTKGLRVALSPKVTAWDNAWHHYAFTRKDGVIRLFVDGILTCHFTFADEIFVPNCFVTGGYFGLTESNKTAITQNCGSIDELLIDDKTCRYTASFDVPTSPYER